MSAGLRQLHEEELLDWLRLVRSDNVGPRTFRTLLDRFGTAADAIAALPELARRVSQRPVRLTPLGEAEREMTALRRAGLSLLPVCDPAYPAALRAIDSAPPLLVVKGDPAVLARPTVGIVGSRNASAAGLVLTERFARGLGQAGYVVASGLARGIDARAHQASLATGTVAVLAGGHDRIYPSEHVSLANRIAESGAVISEMPFGWEPRGRDFPRRNRIVSGLSLGVLVVEAAQRSGSLITARLANEQGRPVFAIPGSPLDPRAEGTNDLLRQGARLCGKPEHLLEELAPMVDTPTLPGLREDRLSIPEDSFWAESDVLEPEPGRNAVAVGPRITPTIEDEREVIESSDTRQLILELTGISPVSVDELVRASGLSTGLVQAMIMDLELEGQLERHGLNAVSRRAD